jgi:hypothetical protein
VDLGLGIIDDEVIIGSSSIGAVITPSDQPYEFTEADLAIPSGIIGMRIYGDANGVGNSGTGGYYAAVQGKNSTSGSIVDGFSVKVSEEQPLTAGYIDVYTATYGDRQISVLDAVRAIASIYAEAGTLIEQGIRYCSFSWIYGDAT